jgi:hypothetical protein
MSLQDIANAVNPANFTINGRAYKFPDIQRTFMWQMMIPGIINIAPSAMLDAEDLLVRCRSVSIPGRTNEPITSNFMGTRQFYPGRADPGGGQMTMEFEEAEDMTISRIFYEWQQVIFNINPAAPISAGKSQRLLKRRMVKDIYLFMFSYAGVPLPKVIRFKNAWVQAVAESALTYEGGDSVKYSVTFQYDYWTQFPDTTNNLGLFSI